MIEEQIDFNRAVEAVIAWVKQNSNWGETVLIVTADHETGYIWGPGSGLTASPIWRPVLNHGEGNLPGFEFYNMINGTMGWHSNSLVPLYAKGNGAQAIKAIADKRDIMRGAYLDNRELHTAIKNILQ
jgi:alkaline phosphatase